MRNRDGSIANDNWKTPKWLYDELNAEFGFDHDPCPYNENPITPETDGLLKPWGMRNFINPPYNRVDKPKFIQRAYEEYLDGKLCVLLIPVSTSTKQFHELILPHAEIRFLKGRVAFEGYNDNGEYTTTNKGKHDSMIVIFKHPEFTLHTHK